MRNTVIALLCVLLVLFGLIALVNARPTTERADFLVQWRSTEGSSGSSIATAWHYNSETCLITRPGTDSSWVVVPKEVCK